MITAAAHNLSFASPLGTIESKLRPFFHLSDASCLGLRGLGQVDASYGFTYAVVGLGGDSLCCNQTSKPSLTSTRRCILPVWVRCLRCFRPVVYKPDRVCYSVCYTRES